MTFHAELQSLLDRALAAPAWAGYTLLALAFVVTLLGRHGQRPLDGALLGGTVFALAFFGLRGVLHAWVPGVVAIIAGVAVAVFGLIALQWGTGLVVAGVFAFGAALAARRLGIPVWALSLIAGSLGLAAGVTNYQRLALVLPPIFSALFAALGAAILWAPHWRGAVLWQLNDVDWALGLWGVLAIILLALSMERAWRARVRLSRRTKAMEDEELKQQLEKRQSAYRKAFEKLQSLPPDDTTTLKH